MYDIFVSKFQQILNQTWNFITILHVSAVTILNVDSRKEAAFKMLHSKLCYCKYYNLLAPVRSLSSEKDGHWYLIHFRPHRTNLHPQWRMINDNTIEIYSQ